MTKLTSNQYYGTLNLTYIYQNQSRFEERSQHGQRGWFESPPEPPPVLEARLDLELVGGEQ
jgi:hypothetical protein